MKKLLSVLAFSICLLFMLPAEAADNGFYDQPYPHGITPIGEVSEDGSFDFVDPDGNIGWAHYKQQELVPQDEIEQIPTTELIRSLMKDKGFMDHLARLSPDHEDWYLEVFNFTYNSFYEMFRRDDLSEALVEVYCSDSVPTKTEDHDFVIGAAIERLMVIDQKQSELYDDELLAKLQIGFWEKNLTREVSSMMDLPGHVHYPGKMFNIGTSDAGGKPVVLITDISEEEYKAFATEKVRLRLRSDTEEFIEGYPTTIYTKENNEITALSGCVYINEFGESYSSFNLATQEAWAWELTQKYGSENIDIIEKATPKYNCHSWAWYNRSTLNPYWISTAAPFLRDSNVSQILVFTADTNDILIYGDFEHSAVMVKRDLQDFGNSVVRSKWGVLPLIDHRVNNPEYFKGSYEEVRAYRIS